MLDPARQMEIIRRGVAEILPEEDLLERLAAGRPLRIKYGIDPTGPDVTLGHAVPLRKLRDFQALEHQVVLIIGDFTALIGDPSGRDDSRPQLTRQQIERNMATYLDQISKILDLGQAEVRHNSEWLGRLTSEQIIRLTGTHTVAQVLAREDFANRFAQQRPIGLQELLYPIYQGYDSIAVQADVEIGATEQKFNFLTARELQLRNPLGPPQRPQVILTLPILVGTDGVQRMGKSRNNYIGVSESPDQMFGKVMSIPDTLIAHYLELCTDEPLPQIRQIEADMQSGQLNPRDAKLRLARDIVVQYHGAEAAGQAQQDFLRLFSGRGELGRDDLAELAKPVPIPPEIQGKPVWASTALVACGLAKSKSEARRSITAGGAYLDDRRLDNPEEELTLRPGMILRIGKRRLVKLT
jgi:tyrosyl-tRNA synthetase